MIVNHFYRAETKMEGVHSLIEGKQSAEQYDWQGTMKTEKHFFKKKKNNAC